MTIIMFMSLYSWVKLDNFLCLLHLVNSGCEIPQNFRKCGFVLIHIKSTMKKAEAKMFLESLLPLC